MNNSNDFTYDKNNYKELPAFVKELHDRNMHYIPLVDPGVSASEKAGTYPPYDKGIEMDIFVKNSSNQPFIGKVKALLFDILFSLNPLHRCGIEHQPFGPISHIQIPLTIGH